MTVGLDCTAWPWNLDFWIRMRMAFLPGYHGYARRPRFQPSETGGVWYVFLLWLWGQVCWPARGWKCLVAPPAGSWTDVRGPLNFDTGVAAAALAPAMTQAQKEWRNANAWLLLGWDGTRIDYRTELFFRIDIFDWFGNTLENSGAEFL